MSVRGGKPQALAILIPMLSVLIFLKCISHEMYILVETGIYLHKLTRMPASVKVTQAASKVKRFHELEQLDSIQVLDYFPTSHDNKYY